VERSEIKEKVVYIISEQLGVRKDPLEETTLLVDDCGMDSLDAVELGMALEEEYGIEIPDEDAEKIKTVGEAIDYIEAKTKK